MHESSIKRMEWFADKYLSKAETERIKVLDVGSYNVNGCYRNIFTDKGYEYKGLDMEDGPNVDVVPRNTKQHGTDHHRPAGTPGVSPRRRKLRTTNHKGQEISCPHRPSQRERNSRRSRALAVLTVPWFQRYHRPFPSLAIP